ncbi:hypothetical protein B0H10DRAFT_1774250 [Mycena sp. CBHHK59/15]|nr:hypothetical protein B0H10DRAFT_1774250 [Mycena sp. CBHHK59/15]
MNALSLFQRHLYSSPSVLTQLNVQALDGWIASPKQLVLRDTFNTERVSDLLYTLPTRDGTRKPYREPHLSAPLGYGWHLAFFHPRAPESQLRPDGTDAVEFCPPEPFTRRMWAGGHMSWNSKNPLRVGEMATSTSTFDSVQKKGFDKGTPMVFVTQKIEITMIGKKEPSVVEERSHVYVAESISPNNAPREVKDIPSTAHFSFTFTPSLTTLFRFSALMFNAHLIHLDKDWAQLQRGYPERLVHGPLTALMLLETIMFHDHTTKIKHFEYRARNPIIVNRSMTINGAYNDDHSGVTVWCVDEEGVVGMTGHVKLGY